MRADFELYGCTLYIDFMKRQMNSYEWPYISIVAMDSNGSPRVVAGKSTLVLFYFVNIHVS